MPNNVRITFAIENYLIADVEGERERDGSVIALDVVELQRAPGLGAFDLGALTAGEDLLLTLGSNFSEPTTRNLTVLEEEDTTAPSSGGAAVLVASFSAFDGVHDGYIVDVNVPRADDDFGIAYYAVALDGSVEGTPNGVATSVFGDPAEVLTTNYVNPDWTEACATVTIVDWLGNRTTSDPICQALEAPTQEELDATRQSGGCFGNPATVAPGFLGVFLFGLKRRRRRG